MEPVIQMLSCLILKTNTCRVSFLRLLLESKWLENTGSHYSLPGKRITPAGWINQLAPSLYSAHQLKIALACWHNTFDLKSTIQPATGRICITGQPDYSSGLSASCGEDLLELYLLLASVMTKQLNAVVCMLESSNLASVQHRGTCWYTALRHLSWRMFQKQ